MKVLLLALAAIATIAGLTYATNADQLKRGLQAIAQTSPTAEQEQEAARPQDGVMRRAPATTRQGEFMRERGEEAADGGFCPRMEYYRRGPQRNVTAGFDL